MEDVDLNKLKQRKRFSLLEKTSDYSKENKE